jgi:hypothetical protein
MSLELIGWFRPRRKTPRRYTTKRSYTYTGEQTQVKFHDTLIFPAFPEWICVSRAAGINTSQGSSKIPGANFTCIHTNENEMVLSTMAKNWQAIICKIFSPEG